MSQIPKRLLWLCLLGPLLACASAPVPKPEASEKSPPDFFGAKEPKSRLMMLGTFHFEDAGLDEYKPQHRLDVLSPERQREVEALVEALAKFQPTRITVEVNVPQQDKLDAQYQDYVAGRAGLTANEVDQVGFRLAKKLGHPKVYAIDSAPHQVLDQLYYAVDEKQVATLDPKWQARFTQLYTHDDELKTRQSLIDHLRYVNSPERIRQGHGAYSIAHFKVDGEDGYLGVDLRTAWYNRNLRIFRNLQRLMSAPEERVLLIIGAGHLPILQFVAETSPEYELVDVRDYLRAQ
ncbi:hypothetical protein D7W82_39090 [Corallococcus sp. CA049B]|uniref:DUF5694 domain-containing protein n=1 Tax=Corallococcus sp. CA049B TaxID=2316730 RepID=UPI000EA12241|nr:DUF5694 domain-containing protein [Corallococcus sp. CA049B]RKG73275.1 hypothetical protein D7W82_39090 [Corallococcus sp. CA049B]